jgi:preprotein translocase subunit Sec63
LSIANCTKKWFGGTPMAEKRDYYEVLGLSKSASDDEIKKAYRKLSKNIIQISIKHRMPKKNSRRSPKHMKY